MEAYLEALIERYGASEFLIVRDDATLTTLPTRKTSLCPQRFSAPSVSSSLSSSLSSASSTACIGPPSLPRRKRSSDDIFSISKGSKGSAQKKAAKNRVLKSFFDEVMGSKAASTNRSNLEYIEDALKLTSPLSKEAARWEASPSFPRNNSM